jgi:adenylate cyclase
VNTASRLEALTKEYDAELVVSQAVTDHAGLAAGSYERHEVNLRGRDQPLTVFVLKRAADLPESVEGLAQKKDRGDTPSVSPRPAV